MLICLGLFSESPEFLMWMGLILPSRGVGILATLLAIQRGALPIPDIMGHMGMRGLLALNTIIILISKTLECSNMLTTSRHVAQLKLLVSSIPKTIIQWPGHPNSNIYVSYNIPEEKIFS